MHAEPLEKFHLNKPNESNAMSTTYSKRILPNQEFNSNLYTGKDDLMNALYQLLDEQAADVKQTTFKLNEHGRVGFEEMSTPPFQLSLLKFLIGITQTKTFLEIGTFIGNTAMHVAKFIGEGADVVTIEKFDEFADLARKNFKDNGLEKTITLHQGDACQIMKELPDNYFDFIYVDGDKGKYLELTKIAEEKISGKGLILVDDVLFHGDVLNETASTEKGRGCKELLEYYKDTTKFRKYLLPLANGILLLKK